MTKSLIAGIVIGFLIAMAMRKECVSSTITFPTE